MTDNLFNLPESPSPRLKWMRENLISIIPMSEHDGSPSHPKFIATKTVIGTGETEDEAFNSLMDLLKNGMNLKLWNETN